MVRLANWGQYLNVDGVLKVRHDQVQRVNIAVGFQYMLGETMQCAHVLCSFTSNARPGAVEPSSVVHIEIAGNNDVRSLLPHSAPPNLSIVFGSTVIAPSDEVKYLGLTLDSTLSFSAHVNYLRKDIGKKLGAFRRGRRNLAVQARRQFYLSVVQSKLEYASTAHVHCLADNVRDQLLRISKRALSCIFEHDTFTRTSYLLERYQIISLGKIYHTKSIFYVFRCIHNICSSLLSDMFSLRRDCAHTDRVTRGQVNYSLSLPIVQTQAGYRSISFLGADRFNALPESLCTNHIPNSFRQEHNNFIHLGHPVRRP